MVMPTTPDSEHAHQVALFQWAGLALGQRPELDLLVAIPNGGHRHKATAGRLKAEGVKSGYPDMALNVPRAGYAGLFIELKRPGGRATVTQKIWLERLNAAGNCARTCYGWLEAKQLIENYLDGKLND